MSLFPTIGTRGVPGIGRGTGVEIIIPKGLLEAEALVKGARRPFIKACAEEIRDVARANLGPSKHIGPSLRVTVLTAETAELWSKHPGAKAQDTGAFVAPKKARVLRFTGKDGTVVYTKGPIRIKGKRYITDALMPEPKRAAIERAFVKVYGPVLETIEHT